MTALVTGATGFIGHWLVRALVYRGRHVRCLVRAASASRAVPDCEPVIGDVTDSESLARAVAGVDCVYHLAGKVTGFNRLDFARVNEQGCANVAQACSLAANPPALVVVSSLSAAGPSLDARPRREEDPVAPVSLYGASKLAGERAAARFAARVPISIVRPPIVFGPRDTSLFPVFRMVWRRGIHAVPGLGASAQYSLCHVDDLASALMLVGERGQRLPVSQGHDANGQNGQPQGAHGQDAQGVYYVAIPETVTYAELGRLVAKALGRRRFLILPAPFAVGWCAAAIGECLGRARGRQGIVNWDKMREATAGSWTCSGEKIQRELDFTVAATLPQRLAETAAWYFAEGWLRRGPLPLATAEPSRSGSGV